MKNSSKKLLCVSLAAMMALPLAACSTEASESSFDNPLPWSPTAVSYEKLEYNVAVYNTEKSEKENEREKIGDGLLTFVLDESTQPGYTELNMSFSLTYADSQAAGIDAGLTDTITSRVTFEPNSLAAKDMTKTVTLADRKDKTNLSYTITADYFGTHTATLKYFKRAGATEQKRSLPSSASRDNEMMYFIARAQNIGESSSTNFKMINVFDSFVNGETAEYTMVVSGGAKHNVDIGDWVKDFGIAAAEGDEASYPVKCLTTTLTINAEKHGPSYTVQYAMDPFKNGSEEHKKLPVKIDYSSYNGSAPYRHISYTLSACSFTK